MQNVKQLIVWAKAQSKQLKTKGEQSGSNIYYARYEWIEFELLPKLEEILHTSSNKCSMPSAPLRIATSAKATRET